ncbi:unnamed protein product [Nezara viridula]|uniref:Uncharacterized protein n=1 Tax=Nezara viridula TaxID=85310 RepID=A0A9P0HB77_NEZVI|nr:unnamed protein product [Nezara viridula]
MPLYSPTKLQFHLSKMAKADIDVYVRCACKRADCPGLWYVEGGRWRGSECYKEKMNSCFPPLAALSLHGLPQPKPEKIEVLQDLDLYYIKQIAHSLKTEPKENFKTSDF